MKDEALKCVSAVMENPDEVLKQREMYRMENARLVSENNDLKNLVLKLLFERYGFGR